MFGSQDILSLKSGRARNVSTTLEECVWARFPAMKRLVRSTYTGRFPLALITAMAIGTQARAQVSDCNELIQLSKVTSQTVSSSSIFQSYEHAFCNDYASYKSNGKAMSAGGAYGPISANFGQSSSSVEAVASQYCESDGSINQSADLYKDYVQQIAPGAYGAYESCITLEHSDITFSFSDQTVQPTYAEYVVNNLDSNNLNSEDITFTASPEISCNWQGRATGQSTYRVFGSGYGRLQCRRHNADSDGFVTMTAAHTPVAHVGIPWPRYVAGAPVSVVQQYDLAIEAANALAASMSGAVVAFNATSCPTGWAEYQPARGRFIRGIDPSGNSVDPSGPRQPGTQQEDAFKKHSHTFQGLAINGTPNASTGTWFGVNPQSTTTSQEGGDETRPKNVALLYCSKV